MKLGTKGRYAVIAMTDLASQPQEKPTTLVEIAQRQALPLSYLEQLFIKLRQKGLVESVRGNNGGYFLALAAEGIYIRDIILATEEKIKSTQCDISSEKSCQGQTERCLTHNLWAGLEKHILDYLGSITLADVCKRRLLPNGCKVKEAVL
ncbi:MAG: Rrf2 family transcriptional regulator [Candidatus Paracaedimonas acanthamoebae]|uniref:Rrf2 family transcriptional regulator n=1 Tax=Candidatus Paracaedimonas acanthamoebae TaxID=244581 RepID=A0A8J7PZS6_9PROT|nr:Rrf2 family transcriptional regulator [Candidatus Paracaedimonas acanthamoebae]